MHTNFAHLTALAALAIPIMATPLRPSTDLAQPGSQDAPLALGKCEPSGRSDRSHPLPDGDAHPGKYDGRRSADEEVLLKRADKPRYRLPFVDPVSGKLIKPSSPTYRRPLPNPDKLPEKFRNAPESFRNEQDKQKYGKHNNNNKDKDKKNGNGKRSTDEAI